MATTASPGLDAFEPHTLAVYGWAYRLLGQHEDAQDVVQDVFLRWAAQCRKGPPDHPRGWLRRVTLNRAVDYARQRRVTPPVPESAAQPPATEEAPGDSVDGAALRADIAAAMDRLTDLQRAVLVAKVYDEMTFSRIASELGLALSTVKTHYLRSTRAVRDQLEPRWAEEESP